MTDQMPEVIRTAGVAALRDHDMQTSRRQLGEFLQRLADKRKIGIDGGRPNRADARQPCLSQHTLNAAVVNVQLPRNGAVAPFLNVVIAKYFGFKIRG